MKRSWIVALAGLFVLTGCTVDEILAPTRPAPSRISATIDAQTPEPMPPEARPRAPVQERIEDFRAPRQGGRTNAVGPGVARPGLAAEEGSYSLSFENADLRDVVRQVLGEILKANYVVDPGVMGTVTLRTNRPLPASALLPTLETVLASRGAALISSGGVYRVVVAGSQGSAPDASAATGNSVASGVLPGTGSLSGGGLGADAAILVSPLQNLSAAEMRPLLQSLLPRGRVLTLSDSRNVIAVAGNAQDLALARDTLTILDVDQLAGQGFYLVTVERADVQVVAAELENIMGSGTQGPISGLVRIQTIPHLGAILVLSPQQRYLEEARQWIARLDRTRAADERQLYVYFMRHGKAADLARTLNGIIQSGGASTARSSSPASPTAPRSDSAATSPLGNPPDGIISGIPSNVLGSLMTNNDRSGGVPPSGLGASTLGSGRALVGSAQPNSANAPALSFSGGADGAAQGVRISVDASRNAIVFLATGREYGRLLEVIAQLDTLPPQVLIEAAIIEVSLNDNLRFGLQYALDGKSLGLSKESSAVLSTGSIPITGTFPGFSATLGSAAGPRAILDALSELTEIKVVSSPRLLVLDNQVARLQVGDTVPIVTQSATSTVTSTPLVVNSLTYRDTGVTLEVTPRINASSLITLEIVQEVSDVARTTSSNIDSPTIRQRRVLSTIAVQSGNSVLLGGLIREEADQTRSGLPALRDLPGVGFLFGSTVNTASRTELVILLTPRVVRDADAARDMTGEVLRRFTSLLELNNRGITTPRPIRN